MEPDTFILTAHGAFSATVLSCLNELYQNGVLCDVTLMAQNLMEFPAHKVVLVSSSGYFKTLLDQGYLLGDDRQISTGMPASQLKILLDFMYTGTLQLTESNLGLIQKAAEQLKIEEAVRLCKEYTETQEKIRKEANALKDTPRSRGRPKKKAAKDTPAEVKDTPKTPGRKPSKKGQEKLKGGKSAKASPPETNNEKLESNRKSIESKRTEDDTDDDDDSDVDDSDKEWEPKGVKIPESKLTRKQKCSCRICKRHFEYHSLLNRHLHQDHRISSTDLADKLKKQSILTHFLSIKKELGTSNMCMTCNRTFKTWSSASLHIKRKHLKHVHRVCRLCFKECSTLTHLRRHQLVKHNFTPFSGDKMLLKCRLCPRVFLYKKSRKSHEFTKHGAMGKDIEKLGGEQPSLRWRRRLRRVSKFKCGACFRRYTTENRLRIHMIKFHGVKNEQRGSHKCMFCELEFPLPKLLNMHVSDCHNCACEEGENGVVLCMICKQMFLRRGDLKRHLHDIHNLNQPIRKNNLQLRSFRCDVQGCTFSTDSTPTLKIHVETVMTVYI
ncbi:zinc finger and BTB domain-containing protein 40-like [Lingula anatina]|uniref:Zinc finger and BTB domain-containing protein 40-like n=1 Tax=Lingula anatina TaxID=7574 RepID=A0A1S3JGK4_LINAN|nr:zinc finger and BTB domain-containing protein 40-like [Lingula anatina]|eukprot:XP_013409276.1 zinc finger and BTB domain-containing protein 40-like [Lingula anatina]